MVAKECKNAGRDQISSNANNLGWQKKVGKGGGKTNSSEGKSTGRGESLMKECRDQQQVPQKKDAWPATAGKKKASRGAN